MLTNSWKRGFLYLVLDPRGKLSVFLASQVAQMVKNLPARQETWVHSLGWEDALEKGMDTYSSILAWRIAQTAWQAVQRVAKSSKD